MTDEKTAHTCAHCDSTEDHEHLDEKGLVDGFLSQLRTSGMVRIVLGLAAAVAGFVYVPMAVVTGVAGWAIATGAGIAAMSAARIKLGTAKAVVLGTVASAAITPVLAWAIATWVGRDLPVALAAAGGWFAAIAVAELVRDRNLSALLTADSRDGEAARQGVLFGNPTSPWVGLAWSIFTAGLVGLWVWVIGLLPLAVLPLVPLHVVLALWTRKR